MLFAFTTGEETALKATNVVLPENEEPKEPMADRAIFCASASLQSKVQTIRKNVVLLIGEFLF